MHVKDFGCGTLALLFAIAWCTAEDLEAGSEIEHVRVDCYDSSRAMIELGKKLWTEFKQTIVGNSSLPHLDRTCQEVAFPYDRAWEVFSAEPPSRQEEERWLTAMHTVYPDGQNPSPTEIPGARLVQESIKESLAATFCQFDPDVGVLTCFVNSQSLLEQASPFASQTHGYESFSNTTMYQTSFSLEMSTNWRSNINEAHLINHPFLNGKVTPSCPETSYRIYTRLDG